MNDGGSGSALYAPFLEQLPVSGASITVVSGTGVQSTICSSDAIATRLEELQFEMGEGPTPAVLRTWRPVLVPDLAVDEAHQGWPAFAPAAVDVGARAMFVLPMLLGAEHVGVVSLYALTMRGSWSDEVLGFALTLVAAAAPPSVDLALRSALAEPSPGSRPTELRRGVHQAAGMVMVQLDSSIEEAMSRLRAHAFAEDLPIDVVARNVVSGVLTFEDDDD